MIPLLSLLSNYSMFLTDIVEEMFVQGKGQGRGGGVGRERGLLEGVAGVGGGAAPLADELEHVRALCAVRHLQHQQYM